MNLLKKIASLFVSEQLFDVVVVGPYCKTTIAKNVTFEKGQLVVLAWFNTKNQIQRIINEYHNVGEFHNSDNETTTTRGMDVILSRYLKDFECHLSITYDTDRYCAMEKRNE